MKKVLSIALALVMMLSICIPAFAADLTSNPASGDVIITTDTTKADGSDAEEYIVTIPADTVIPWGQEATDVSYSVEAHLKRDGRVAVAVAGTGSMKTDPAMGDVYEIPYTLDGAGIAFQADTANIYPAATQTVTVNVTALDWNTAVVEAYSDIITYTSEIVRV